jgi:hypothetical protein
LNLKENEMSLKTKFNAATQWLEDAAFGYVLPGMNERRRLGYTLYGSMGVAMTTVGAVLGDSGAFLIGTGVVASAAFGFQQRGENIRRALEAQPK